MEVANYDTAFANFQAAASALSGDTKPILKFDKGDWYAGQDNEEVPIGTQLAVDMMSAEWGWVRWKDNKPAERRMTLIATGQSPPARDALGHSDEALWERDDKQNPRDPWQRTIEMPMREISGDKREFTVAGASKGFEGCCKALFKAFGEQMRANIGKVPIVELRSDKYTHRQYGIVKVPSLPLVGWKTLEELETVKSEPAATKKQTKF